MSFIFFKEAKKTPTIDAAAAAADHLVLEGKEQI